MVPIAVLTPPLTRIISIAKSYHCDQDWIFHPVFLYTEAGIIHIPANGQELIIQENDISALTHIRVEDEAHSPAVAHYLQEHHTAWSHLTAALESREFAHKNGVMGYYGFTAGAHEGSRITPARIVFRIETESRQRNINGQLSTVHSYIETNYSAKDIPEMKECFVSEEEVIKAPFMTQERVRYLEQLTNGESLWTSLGASISRAALTNGEVRRLLENNTVSHFQFGTLYNGIYHETEVPDIESIHRVLRRLILQINA